MHAQPVKKVEVKMMKASKLLRSKVCLFIVLALLSLYGIYELLPMHGKFDEQKLIRLVKRSGVLWKKNKTATTLFRQKIEKCCDPLKSFALTQKNSPVGKKIWFDGELFHWITVDNDTFGLFPPHQPLGQKLLKRCAIVGNSAIMLDHGCGKDIDKADVIFRCNLPPITKQYEPDIGTKTHLVTANPSIIQIRYQNLLWSRRAFSESMRAYGHSFVYMPAFSMRAATESSLRVYHTLHDCHQNQTTVFANPSFLHSAGTFWTENGVRAMRLSTGMFLVSAALGMCEDVHLYGFWPFSEDLSGRAISHHYYDDVPPLWYYHAMPEEFEQLWMLHQRGILRMHLEQCEPSE
ncbi:alpha-N-acetylneuraminide alpha-2,8-sialyltransferase [Lampetra fluviatilis]